MRSPRFKKRFASLPALNLPQRRQVLDALRPAAGLDQLLALLTQRQAERCCPGCASTRWHRHGQANGLQRYRCRDCRRTLTRFHGVASRYLPNYLDWRRALDGGRVGSAAELPRLAIKPIHGKS